MMKSSQPTDPESGDTLFHSRQFSAILLLIFLTLPFQNLLRAIENIGIVSVYGIRYLTTGNVTQQNYIKYVEHDTLIWEYLNSSIHLAPYLEKKFKRIYSGEAYRFYRKR